MTAASKAAAITRWGAVVLMATAVLTATAGGFAQSYAGLYQWALEHGLHGSRRRPLEAHERFLDRDGA